MDQVAWRAPFALVETDGRGLIVSANEKFLAWAEVDPTGKTVPDALHVDPAEFDAAVHRLDTTTLTSISRQQGIGPVRVAMSITYLEDGRRVFGLADVDRQHATMERLLAIEAASTLERTRLGVLLQAAVSFGNASSDEQLSELLVDVLKSVFDADEASVHLHRDGEFVGTAGHNPLVANWPPTMPPPGTHTTRAARVQIIQSPEEAEELLPGLGMGAAMRTSEVGAVIVAPIIEHGTPFGAVGCYFIDPRTFDDQTERLIVAVAQQAAAVFSRLRVERDLRRVAMLDEVTGLPNRRLFETQLERSGRWGTESLALVFIDLDGFKQVNDQLGHAAGDALLAEVAGRLRDIQRAQDAVCRLGGDEFVAYFEAVDLGEAEAIAERVRRAVAEPYAMLPDGLHVTASVGVALTNRAEGLSSVDQLIREADFAMYEAKKAGGDTVLAR